MSDFARCCVRERRLTLAETDLCHASSREYAAGMTERYPLRDKQVFGSDVDDDDMDAILRAMDKLDSDEAPESTEK